MDPQQVSFSSDSFDQEPVEQKPLGKIKKISLSKLPKRIKKLYQSIKNIDQNYLFQQFKLPTPPTNAKISKQVCAKNLVKNQQIVQCYQCRFDASCVICMECFKNGNHQGHKFVIRKAVGGCCDCGDKQAWKQSGFCKNHSGNQKQIQIDQKSIKQSQNLLHGLFYIYFYLTLTQHQSRNKYSESLVSYMLKINTQNPYYNKITAICFNDKLSEKSCYSLSQEVDSCTILQNLLIFRNIGSGIEQWMKVFYPMFGYYPFKMALAKCYIQKFGNLVDGSLASMNSASSISCQILTSHQLIQKYSIENKIGVGQQSPVFVYKGEEDIKKLLSFYIRMYRDLENISNLTKPAPLKYWNMHINNPENLSNIFQYYNSIYKVYIKSRMNGASNIHLLIKVVQVSQVQQSAICLFTCILKTIKKQENLLHRVIKFLWQKCCQNFHQTDPQFLCILRPYQRCFGLALFCLSNCQLQQLQNNRHLIQKILQLNQKKFIKGCLFIFQKILETYLLYCRTIVQVGLRQSLYYYLYFYKIKYHVLSSTDIICLKILIILSKEQLKIKINGLINLAEESQLNEAQVKQKRVYLNCSINFIKYLYISSVSQAHMSYQINPEMKLYKNEISDILQRYFNENKGVVSIQKMNIFKIKLFSQNVSIIDQWLKQNCNVNKQKKAFVLKKQVTEHKMNLSDLWQNQLSQNAQLNNPQKTVDLVKGQNLKIFNLVWNKFTLTNLAQTIHILFTKGNQKGVQLILSNILHVYLIKKQIKDQSSAELIKKKIILPYIDGISAQFKKKLKQITKQQLCFAGTKQQSNKQKQQAQVQVLKRKSKMQEIKQKKMQKFKQAQQKILNMQNQDDQKQMMDLQVLNKKISVSSKISQQLMQETFACCICKNDKKQDLVFLVTINSRNFQKLSKLGKGTNCISYNSCFHTFDYACIKQNFYKQGFAFSVQCPLCKTWAQMLLPITLQHGNNDKSSEVINRIYSLLASNFMEKQKGSIFQQIVKGFYHFILMCYIDTGNLFSKKSLLYENVCEVIKSSIKYNQITQQEQLIIKNYMSDLPSLQVSKQQQEKLYFVKAIRLFFQKLRNKITQKQEQMMQLQGLNQNDDNIVKLIKICYKRIFKQKITEDQTNFVFTLPRPQLNYIFKPLPLKYPDIGYKKQCSQCKQTKSQMYLCLYCHWVGCQKCENSGTKDHTYRNHGGIGAFMDIQTSIGFYQSPLSYRFPVGQLYQNQWGHNLIKNEKWQQFEINSIKINQMENNIINDKIIQFRPKNVQQEQL